MSSKQKPSEKSNPCALIWGIALSVIGCVAIGVWLALVEEQPNWTDITLAVATVGLTLATIGLAVAAFKALGALNESRHDRNVLVMNDLSARWDNEHFRNVRHKIHEIAGSGADSRDRLKDRIVQSRDANYAEYSLLLTEPGFLEDLAISIKHGGVDKAIVAQSLGYIIWDRWCLWEPAIAELRRLRRDESSVFENFAWLAEEMHKVMPHLESSEAWEGPKY